eukprot:757412-Hanusia_phi.AAC.1
MDSEDSSDAGFEDKGPGRNRPNDQDPSREQRGRMEREGKDEVFAGTVKAQRAGRTKRTGWKRRSKIGQCIVAKGRSSVHPSHPPTRR